MTLKVGESSAHWAEKAKLDFWYEPSTTSTNLIAKESAFTETVDQSPIAVYFTDHQSLGRGRGTNKWFNSKDNSSLLSSWSFLLAKPPHPLITCQIGLACYRALLATWPDLPFSLKAPNDIFLNDKKLAGILVETISEGQQHRLILGLGLNVFSVPSILESATCLQQNLPKAAIDLHLWESFLDRLLLEFSLTLSHPEQFMKSEKWAWIFANNLRLPQEKQFTDIDSSGNILTLQGVINWFHL